MDSQLDLIEKQCDQISRLMTQEYDRENGQEVSGKISEFNSLLATSATLVATAEMVYNERLGRLAETYQDRSISATDKKNIFAGKLTKETYFVTLTERLNRALTHSIEGLRSQLSFIKAEVNNVRLHG
jgi:hypothetical protein